jgi:uncharacterized repeat protein (TIGR01451 family)
MLTTTPIGVLLLDHTGADALLSASTGGTTVNGGGALVIDSKSTLAGVDAGTGNVSAVDIDVTGKLKAYGSGQFQGTILHPSPSADPLATLPVPTAANKVQKLVNVSGHTSITLSPGTYAGIIISGNGSVTLQPGVYILKGSGLQLYGNGKLSGTGVTIYNASGPIQIGASANVNLSAPTSGTYKNVVLFQARGSTTPVIFSGGNINLAGMVYAPKARLTVTGTANVHIGNPALGITSELIVDDLTTAGSARLNVDATPGTMADLAVTMTGSMTADAGNVITYTIPVSNNGPDVAQNVEMLDVFPSNSAESVAQPGSGPQFHTVLGDNSVTATIATLNPGDSQTFTVGITTNSDETASPLESTATVSTTSFDPNSANNSATVDTTITQEADLTVSMTGPATAIPGENVTYHITVTNNGPSDAQPIGLASGLTGDATSVSVTQTAGPGTGNPLPAGGTETFDYEVSVDSTATIGGTITPTTNAGSLTSDPNTTNNSATANTTIIAPSADLAVTMTGPSVARDGDLAVYTITLANNGPNDAQNVVLTDTLPMNASAYGIEGVNGAVYSNQGSSFTDAFGTLESGAQVTFTVSARVDSNAALAAVLTNAVLIISNTSDPDTTNNFASISTTVVATDADLAVTMTGPSTIAPGDTGSYTITVTNNGPDDAQNVVLTVPFPMDYLEIDISASNATAQNATSANLSVAFTETLPTLSAGAQATFTLHLAPDPSALAGADFSEDLSVTSDTPDPDSTNNADAFPITVAAPVADLDFTMTGPSSAAPGDVITYHMSVTNNGPSDAPNFGIAFADVPDGVMGGSFTQTSGPTGTSLPAGTTATFDESYTVDNDTPLGTVLSYTVEWVSDASDPDSTNNTVAVSTTIVAPSADVAVSMTGSSTATAGDNYTYDITVTNNGPTVANNVVLSDTLPANTSFSSVFEQSVPAGTNENVNGSTITATVPTLAPGAQATFTLNVTIDAATAADTQIKNTVSVTSDTSDPVSANNSSSVTTTVGTKADLTVNMTGSDNINAGENQIYDITVTNNGPSDAQNYTFSYSVSTEGVTSVSLVQDSGPSNGETLAAGSTAFYELSVLTDPMAPDMTTVNVLAQVTSDTTDPDISNNNTGIPVTLNAP